MNRRDFAVGAVMLLSASTLAAQQPNKVAVFVCEHGAGKSVIAAAYFNKVAAERGIPYRAVARGTSPDPEFGATTVEGLRADGLAIPTGNPQKVSDGDLKEASVLVTMSAEVKNASPLKKVEWNDVPSPSDYRKSRDAIRSRVEKLVDELAAGKQ